MQIPEDIRTLIHKYNRPGPRYTSYPTAPHFSAEVDSTALEQACTAEHDAVSLYVHIPFCASNCWFCGCNTIITNRQKKADAYIDLLGKELELMGKSGMGRRVVSQLHFGGGTPNFLSPEQTHRVFALLRSSFDFEESVEISVEMAPNYLDEAKLDAFFENGLKRASFGVQDIDPRVQEAINRIQPMDVNRWTVDALRSKGIESINIDLVYGLPHQSVTSYAETLKAIQTLDPDRLAVFNYAHVPHIKPYQSRLEKHPMPKPEQKIDLLLSIISTLNAFGYDYIGMDHFAKPEDELNRAQKSGHLHRNFQGYTVQEANEVVALGVSSISETKLTYRQNHKTIEAYEASINSGQWPIARGIVLSETDVLRRSMIQSIMCNLRLAVEDFIGQDQATVREIIDGQHDALSDMQNDGLLECSETAIEVSEKGRLFLRNIAMCFDAYLGKGEAKFSKTV